mmetsp:Transcript_12205/g.22196  ORF Transcript_12205/g.22196 Transcript_12205/m.22196 type:complete len:672 (+) Transcript_12205:358-2373(+)
MFVYDIVESSPPGSRVRCQDIDVVAALLKSHAFKMFQSSDVGKLAVEFNKDTAEDHPAVFQAFVWAETNGSLSANTAIVGTGDKNENHIGDARLHSTVSFAVDVEQQSSERSITSEEWMTPTKSHWIRSPVSILKEEVTIETRNMFSDAVGNLSDDEEDATKVPEEKAEPVAQMTTHSAEQQEMSKQKRERPTVCCTFGSSGGNCNHNGSNERCKCKKCKRHCTCGAKEAAKKKAQAQRKQLPRVAAQEALPQIEKDSINKTPAKIKEADPDYRSFKDFFQVVPRRPELLRHLHDNFRIFVKSSRSQWDKLRTYVIDVILKLGETVTKRDEIKAVQERLLREVQQDMYAKKSATRVENCKDKIVNTVIAHAKGTSSSDDDDVKCCHAIVAEHLSHEMLAEIQSDAGVPEDQRLRMGKKAKTQGRRHFRKLIGGEDNGDDSLDEVQQLGRISDEVVSHAVGFIMKNCNVISWGEKVVPIGDGETTTIPNLTRMCTTEEMWQKYSEQKESEKLPFRRIISYEGPLREYHDSYKGSAYNVQLEWVDKPPSFKPLSAVSLDDPVTCALFGQENHLLDKSGWTRLKWYLKDDGTGAKDSCTPTLKAFKGGRKMIGRSMFFEVVRTGGEDKLVRPGNRPFTLHACTQILFPNCCRFVQLIASKEFLRLIMAQQYNAF